MTRRLIWKLFGVNILITLSVIAMVWGGIDYMSTNYFTVLQEVDHIHPESSRAVVLNTAHRYWVWAGLGGLILAAALSVYFMRRMLVPITRMTAITNEISRGDYTSRAPATSRDEVGQLAQAFNQMAENLMQIESFRKNMIVNVAHEFRAPLTNIKGYIKALSNNMLSTDPAMFALLQEETDRLVRLVENILRLAKTDAAHRRIMPEGIVLSELINKEIKPLEPLFDSKSIQIQNQVFKTTETVWADPNILAQILRKLFENGWQYTPAGGSFRIFTKKNGDHINITCENTCSDIVQKDLPFLFERFYRGGKFRSQDHGVTGIGLAIVKDLVQAHGGRVSANLVGKCLQIEITLSRPPKAAIASTDR